MTTDRKLKQIFSKILGADIELEPISGIYKEYSEKELFIDFINQWVLAWNRGNLLLEEYGVNFQQYDDLLYSALEDLTLLKYGEVRYRIIVSYIYSDIMDKEDHLIVVDKNNKKYEIYSVEDLYQTISVVKDEDFTLDNEEEK